MTDIKNSNVSWGDLENLDDLDPKNTTKSSPPAAKAGFGLSDTDTGEQFIEDCPKCGGTGRFYSYTGRYVGPCHACKGKGRVAYKNPANVRAKHKQQREDRKEAVRVTMIKTFRDNPDTVEVYMWLKESAPTFEFARSLWEGLNKYGSLTEKQLAAARRSIEAKAKAIANREAAKSAVDLSSIRAKFEEAVANGHKKPTYRAEGLIINRAPDHGKNPGALYVKNLCDEYGGKIQGDIFSPSREADRRDFATQCYNDPDTGEEVTVSRTAAEALVVIAEDPEAAVIRWGHRSGNCGICGRELTVKESVERGIGPICAAKWGIA